MKLDAVFFNLIPRVNRHVARLDLQLAFVSAACQYAESHQNIPSALHSKTHKTNHRGGERRFAAVPRSVLRFFGTLSLYYNLPLSLSLNPPFPSILTVIPLFFPLSWPLRLKAALFYSFLLTKVGCDRPFLSFPLCHLKYTVCLFQLIKSFFC